MWKRKDNRAQSLILSTIEEQQQRTLIVCRSAHEMWLRLSAQYLQNASDNKYLLQKQFYEYKFKSDHDVLTHIIAIELMAAQL